jgi:hypothetical protein
MRFENIGRRPIMIRGERERVQILFNFRQTLGNAGRIYLGRTMCVYYTSSLYPVTGATRVVYIKHKAGKKKNFISPRNL